jgi:hypothetical protein
VDEQEIAWVASATDPSGPVAFWFMVGPGSRAANWSMPKIASGRWTRGRLAAYWPDGFVLVPMHLDDRDTCVEIGPNWGRRGKP